MKTKKIVCDFLIVGAGIIGICTALTLRKRFPKASIHLIEKEPAAGLHASGRNSGVLHAGFYYSKDSLKAKFSKAGNEAWTQFCIDRQLPINRCGKLVVAKDEHDLPGLTELFERGKKNGIPLHYITKQEAKSIESRAKTYEFALFSPSTASVDPKMIIQSLLKDLIQSNIQLHCDEPFIKRSSNNLLYSKHYCFDAAYFINCAGLYADKIAKQFGLGEQYDILPFKGLYLYGNPELPPLKTHIYPVPNLANPFLGVHFTMSVHQETKIGPTAIPALWREHYQGLGQFKLNELLTILARQTSLLFNANFDFINLAKEELKKYNRRYLIQQASQLLEGVEEAQFKRWGKPGIRAQLLNRKEKKLEMDFIVEQNERSLHVLNAVSPAFTCALPFSEHLVNHIVNANKNELTQAIS